jgi:tRNA(Ile)-lysidine synthase
MLDSFLKHIASQNLHADGKKTLIATSGGVDSVVLCYLFHQAAFPFAIAHCNFQLRGSESDGDEALVAALAVELGVPYYAKRFDTQVFAEQNKISIQEAARKLRYDWLEENREMAGCEQIATAHHLDDSIETLLYNFAKGCGLRGLHGILPRNGNIIRPMLFATKREVLDFAEKEAIAFREDASNLTDKYSRNQIRHHIIPVFEKINPNFQRTAEANLRRLKEAEQLYDFAVNQIREAVMEKTTDGWRIALQKLRSYPAPSSVLYELLSPFGFNNDQVAQILQSVDNQPGSIFHALGCRLLVDRFFLILSSGENTGGVFEVPAFSDTPIQLPNGACLHLSLAAAAPEQFDTGSETAWFDAACLQFPLRLRHWQKGDWFCPLGMGGKRQKLQDFFSNNKISRFEKERIWLLESNGEIAWVIGWRMDERFKVTQVTNTCIRAMFLHNSGPLDNQSS